MPQEEVVMSQIGENLRFYADMRFKQLTLLMAWLTFAGVGVVQRGTSELAPSVSVRTVIACASMLFTGVLWVMEVRATLFWVAHRAEAPEIWPLPKKPFWRYVRATNVVLFLYAGIYILWLLLSFQWGLSLWWVALLAVLFLGLTVFSIGNYLRAFAEKAEGVVGATRQTTTTTWSRRTTEAKVCYRKLRHYKYQLMEEYTIRIEMKPDDDIVMGFLGLTTRGELTIKERYAWDGPSGPTVDTKTFMRGSLVHDALYQLMREKRLSQEHRKYADEVLREICLEDGMCRLRAWWVYKGVRIFAARYAKPSPKPPDELIWAPKPPASAGGS